MNGKGVMSHASAINVYKLYTENRKRKTENFLHSSRSFLKNC